MSSTITTHSKVSLTGRALTHAKSVVGENYKLSTPLEFQKHRSADDILIQQIAAVMDWDHTRVDSVFFSCPNGADPHVDKLNLADHSDITAIIPVILPKGKSTLHVGGDSVELEVGRVYSFNHQTLHSLSVENKGKGCVVIMSTERKNG